MIVRQLLTKWGVEVNDRQLRGLNRKIKIAKQRFDEAGKASIAFGKKLTLFATAPILTAGAAMIKLASDAEETRNKFNEIFKQIAPAARKSAKEIADSFGLSVVTAEELLGKTGDLLVGLKLNQQSAFDLSAEILTLSQDLASFKNVAGGAPRVVDAITKALLGEREMLKTTIQTSVREEEVQARMIKLRAKGVKGTKAQIKAIATLRIIQERNTAAIGDFARTQDQFANQSRIFTETLKDVAIVFGEVLLPVATQILREFLIPFLRKLRDLDKGTRTTIILIGAFVAALGPALIAFGLMAKGLTAVIATVKILIPLIKGLKLASLGLAAVWLAAFAVVFLVLEDILAFAQGRKSVLGFLVQEFGKALNKITEKFKKLPKVVRGVIAFILTPIRALLNGIQGIAGALGALTQGDFKLAGQAIKEAFKNTLLPNLDDFGSIIGFDASDRRRPTPSAQAGANAGAAASMRSNTQINNEFKISVPQGTPPELVGDAVTKGVKQSMDQTFRETREVVQPQVAF